MVLVEDASGQTTPNPTTNTEPTSQSSSSNQNTTTVTVKSFIINDKISFVLWLTRLFTIVCSLLFLFPFSSYDQQTLYSKILLGSAATSALKLHQRLVNEPFQLSRVYFQNLIIEDSFHYLLYSIIFLNATPITIVIMPVCLFAILHIAAYTNALLKFLSPTSLTPIRKAANYIMSKDKEIMRFAAINEIILMPCIVLMLLSGRGGIFMPFVYYRFICFRYQSRRNPYNRQVFAELKFTVEYYINQPKCPAIVRSISLKAISFLCRLAPQ